MSVIPKMVKPSDAAITEKRCLGDDALTKKGRETAIANQKAASIRLKVSKTAYGSLTSSASRSVS